MKYYADLHIHSVLSPCADLLMTMETIFNRLKENEISIFSITDHNSAKNLRVFSEKSKQNNMLFIPGIEVQSIEEAHILTYFRDIDAAEEFGNLLFQRMPRIENREDIFGYQLILDSDDEFCEKENIMLSGSVELGIDEIYAEVKKRDGIIVPAHIDRSNSILSNLGYIPELSFDGLEIYSSENIKDYVKKYNLTTNILSSSDSHFENTFCKPKMYFNIDNLTIENVFKAFKEKKIEIV